jgi:hypothetical protein
MPLLIRSWPRVQSAKAAITGDYVRAAFLNRAVLAVPVHVSAESYYRAPGGITVSSAGRSSEPRRRRKGNNTNCQFRKGHDNPSLALPHTQDINWCLPRPKRGELFRPMALVVELK